MEKDIELTESESTLAVSLATIVDKDDKDTLSDAYSNLRWAVSK